MTRVKIAHWGAFYKYGTFSQIERIRPMLCESKFYFAPPSQLNDPSDCRNLVKDHSADEIEEFLIKTNRLFYGDTRGDDYIRRGIKQFGVVVLLDEMSKQFNKIMDSRYGVFSLAKRPDKWRCGPNMQMTIKAIVSNFLICRSFHLCTKLSTLTRYHLV